MKQLLRRLSHYQLSFKQRSRMEWKEPESAEKTQAESIRMREDARRTLWDPSVLIFPTQTSVTAALQ